MTEKDLIEKREFLLKEPRNSAPVPISESRNLISHIPENVPLLRIKKADENQPGETIYKTFFDPQIVKITHRSYSTSWSYSSPDAYYEKERDYLDSDFEKDVNRVENEETVRTKYFQPNKISNSLTPANPTSILTATSPKMVKDSPFIEFRKIAIISLKNPDSFHSNLFENSIIEALQNRVTVTNTNFVWETKEGLRKLNVPMLGGELGYRLKDGKLFVSNSLQFLGECISGGNNSQLEAQHFSDLTIIRNRNRSEIFDDPMRKLEIEKWDFFTGNVSSLLDLAADVRQIEIRRITKNNLLSEEVSVRIDSGK